MAVSNHYWGWKGLIERFFRTFPSSLQLCWIRFFCPFRKNRTTDCHERHEPSNPHFVFDNKSKKWPKIILFSHVKSSISEKTAQKPRGCQLLGENWLETSSLLSSLSRHRLSTIDELILSFSLQVFYWVFGSSRLAFLLFNTLLKEKSLQICIGAHSRRSKLKNGLSGGLVVL